MQCLLRTDKKWQLDSQDGEYCDIIFIEIRKWGEVVVFHGEDTQLPFFPLLCYDLEKLMEQDGSQSPLILRKM